MCVRTGLDVRLRSHCFRPPSKLVPAAMVRTAARAVVPDDLGKVVCRLVFVWADTKATREAVKTIAECMLMVMNGV